jgi:hypothetical protein
MTTILPKVPSSSNASYRRISLEKIHQIKVVHEPAIPESLSIEDYNNSFNEPGVAIDPDAFCKQFFFKTIPENITG